MASKDTKEKEYILKASDMESGESLYIPVETKKEQQTLFTKLCKYAREYMAWIDNTINLIPKKTFKDGKLWVMITKETAPRELFVVSADKANIRKLED